MAAILPPIPYKTPLLDRNGYLNEAWSRWFRDMFERIGGTRALSNTELENLQSDNLEDVEADILALQSLTSSHTTDLTSLQSSVAALQVSINDLNQGRQL